MDFRLTVTSLLAGAALIAGAESRTLTVTATNTLPATRHSQPVIVNLEKYAPGLNATRAVATIDGKEIASQLDDLDHDGKADELVMVIDIPAKKKAVISVTLHDEGSQAEYEPMTNAYIKLRDEKKTHVKVNSVAFPGDINVKTTYNSIYGHGAVMEGMHNALRVYMDNRQSIDLYGKSTPRLELEVTGFYTTPEQLAEGYGRDILWAGKSVAAGSFRGYQDGAPCTIDTVSSRGQEIIASGPLRSIIEVTDRDWIYNGTRHQMKQRYTMYAGRHDFDVDINITGITGNDRFCTGIQKLETDNHGFIDTDGLAGSWGSNIPDKKQPELVESLGLGLYVGPANNGGMVEDEYNYLSMLIPDADGNIHYSVNVGAEREAGGFKMAQTWFDNLKNWQKELSTPCKIEIK